MVRGKLVKNYISSLSLVHGDELVVTDWTLFRAMARSVYELIELMLDTCRHLVFIKSSRVAETYIDFPRLLR